MPQFDYPTTLGEALLEIETLRRDLAFARRALERETDRLAKADAACETLEAELTLAEERLGALQRELEAARYWADRDQEKRRAAQAALSKSNLRNLALSVLLRANTRLGSIVFGPRLPFQGRWLGGEP